MLARAHEGGRPLELLGGQKTQRVAHEHGHAAAAPVVAGDRALEPADGQGEGGEAEVGLGLAATGREEEQVDEPASGRPLGMGGIGEGGQVHENEGELEGPPGVVLGGGELRQGGVKLQVGVVPPAVGRQRVDPLQPHGPVGEPKGLRRVGVGDHQVDAGAQPLCHLPSVPEGHIGGVLVAGEACLGIADPCSLLVEPSLVGVGKRGQPVS